jgi:hypothetical protein
MDMVRLSRILTMVPVPAAGPKIVALLDDRASLAAIIALATYEGATSSMVGSFA